MERLTTRFPNGYLFRLPNVNDEKAQQEYFEKLSKKVGEYEDAEEQGLLLRLPCKVNDTVYIVVLPNKEIEKMKVRSIEIFPTISKSIRFWCTCKTHGGDWFFYAENFGKIVFRTKKQAEQALKQIGE